MSSPSTPRTTRSASPTADSPAMMTPGRKIKAMLAAFDSDSESDKETSKPLKTSAELFSKTRVNESTATTDRQQTTTDLAADESSDDDDIAIPKGRMAARMQSNTHTAGSAQPASAFERVSQALHATKERADDQLPRDATSDKEMSAPSDDDDDDLPAAGPRRRLANAKRTTAGSGDEDVSDAPRSPARAFSPLFVSSPTGPKDADEPNDSEEEDGVRPKGNARFLALVAQKRKEREEKERLESEKKAERAQQREQLSSELQSDGDEESGDDGASRRKLAKQTRAPRKASKKAMEEMHRETQRMSRNMQLAHQAQAKKKITKESLFARFNFMQPQQQQQPDSSSTAADSQQSSDIEANKDKETPHTSPVMGPSDKPSTEEITPQDKPETTFPTLEEMVSGAQKKQEAPEASEVTVAQMVDRTRAPQSEPAARPKEKKVLTAPPIRVRLTRQQVAQNQEDDSDSDLEVVTSPGKIRSFAAFENHSMKRHQESQAMLKLKALANLTSPNRKTGMTAEELSAKLINQARQQALQERKDRIAELRARGVIVETAAERAAMEDELENLVEKARKEAEDIAKQERKAYKKEKLGDGDDSEDEDEEYEYSDSEGDVRDDENENEEEGRHGDANIFDSEAGEGDDSEDEQSETMSSGEGETATPTQRRKRPTRVISDDEEEDGQEPTTPAKSIVPSVRSVERPHIPVASNAMTMSLTQAFAGTLANGSQSQMGSSTMPHSLPDPAVNMADDHHEPDSQVVIKDSQEQRPDTTDILPAYAQSEARVSESPGPRNLSQFSQIPDPTQDEGFVLSPFDPSKRFLGTPTSTIETVLVNRNDSRNNTPVPEQRGKRLRRGREADLSVIQEQEEGGDFEIEASAFNVMKKAAKKPSVPFDRKKSKAKDVVEDAAEESDDEYAGLGGGSDEEEDEENAYDRQMINDNSGEVVDEKELAALNALHQRNADEKQVEKLLKDITTGALRRRKGAGDDFDLDDSDDELLARRREKQREFARMRRALLADEKIGELAENPKKAAFFKSLEDRDDDDDDLEFLDYKEPTDSQDTSSQDVAPETQQNDASDESNKRKRPLEPTAEDTNNRPPPHMRRRPANAMSKKPATLAEIRQTVSFLTERPEYDSFREDASVDEEDDQQDEAEEQPVDSSRETSPARVHPRRTRGPVVDRLALLRQASSNSASSGSSNNRMAFHAGSRADSAASIGFRPPPMVRRMTGSSTSSTSSSKSDSRVSKPTAPTAKKGAVNYYTAAREKERERELRARGRSGGSNINALLNKHAANRLGALGGKGEWD